MIEVEILAPEPLRPPLPGPLILHENGTVLMPQPDGAHAWVPLDQGLSLAWMNLPEFGGILLSLRDAFCKSDGLAVTLTRPGLLGLIADLQSIDAQLDAG